MPTVDLPLMMPPPMYDRCRLYPPLSRQQQQVCPPLSPPLSRQQ